jgi:hypothetical protein
MKHGPDPLTLCNAALRKLHQPPSLPAPNHPPPFSPLVMFPARLQAVFITPEAFEVVPSK